MFFALVSAIVCAVRPWKPPREAMIAAPAGGGRRGRGGRLAWWRESSDHLAPTCGVGVDHSVTRRGASASIARRRPRKEEMAMSATGMMKMTVPMTLTCGGRLLRMVPQIQTGNVLVVPDVKLVTTKSAMEG